MVKTLGVSGVKSILCPALVDPVFHLLAALGCDKRVMLSIFQFRAPEALESFTSCETIIFQFKLITAAHLYLRCASHAFRQNHFGYVVALRR